MRSGQALVLVMMVLAVAMTVGLSIVARSANEVKVTSAQEESARALEAAEAGLEKALGGTLQIGGYPYPTLGSGATYVIAPTPVLGNIKNEWIIPFQLVEGQVATVDLKNFTKPNIDKMKIRLCWGTSGSSTPQTVLEATLYYVISGNTKIGRLIYDPTGTLTSSEPTGSFIGQLNLCPPGFKYSKVPDWGNFGSGIDEGTQLLMMRLKLYGNGTNAEPIAIKAPGADFGRQGETYISVGSAGTSTQKVRAVQLNYDIPTIFDNAVFSGTSISK